MQNFIKINDDESITKYFIAHSKLPKEIEKQKGWVNVIQYKHKPLLSLYVLVHCGFNYS